MRKKSKSGVLMTDKKKLEIRKDAFRVVGEKKSPKSCPMRNRHDAPLELHFAIEFMIHDL